MNFYTQQHNHSCGIDLQARAMYVCILDHSGTKLVHKNLPTTPEAVLRVIAPYIVLLTHLWIGPIPAAFNRLKAEGAEEG
jgi:predicted NBD/HSP70 family sugar kinase